MNLDIQICHVAVCTDDMHPVCCIEHIYDFLLHIPVGEVFTSPVLEGTNGKLHVSQVYLNELNFLNLEIDFKDGMIDKYTCTNFEDEEENRKYISDNVLFHHDTLPMGEFAKGTNTTAYRMARVYDIAAKMPLIYPLFCGWKLNYPWQ